MRALVWKNGEKSIFGYSQKLVNGFRYLKARFELSQANHSAENVFSSLVIGLFVLISDPFTLILLFLIVFIESKPIRRFINYLCLMRHLGAVAVLLDFFSHLVYQRPFYEYALYSFTKAYLVGYNEELLMTSTIFTVYAALIEKDCADLFQLSQYFKNLFHTEKSLNENSKEAVIIIDGSLKIHKFNKKSSEIFPSLRKNADLQLIFPTRGISQLRKMLEAAKLNKIPEQDMFFPSLNSEFYYFSLTLKSFPFNENNLFILSILDVSLSAKKRLMVLSTYLSKQAVLESIELLLRKKSESSQFLSLSELTCILNYLSSQREALFITERVSGQISPFSETFHPKLEAVNIIQQQWQLLKQKSLKINLLCDLDLPFVIGDKIKHTSALKAILVYIAEVSIPGTEVLITICRSVFFN